MTTMVDHYPASNGSDHYSYPDEGGHNSSYSSNSMDRYSNRDERFPVTDDDHYHSDSRYASAGLMDPASAAAMLADLQMEEALLPQVGGIDPRRSYHGQWVGGGAGTDTNLSLGTASCSRCGHGFSRDEEIVNSSGEMWHTHCFVCAQCFRPFPDGIFYEFDKRKYCEDDFKMLFAPFCAKKDCNNFIVGRVIKAMNANWHPDCFLCELCNVCLADSGYFKNANRALCKLCNDRENAAGKGKYICMKCKSVVEDGLIKYKGEPYHAYHFNCKKCNIELTSDAREVTGELYCLRCHDKMGIPICGACRRPIDGERIVHALGKSWHVEHFVCAQCEKPFLGTRHYEKKGLAYCETHYHQLFGNICFTCNKVIEGDVFSALNKAWCVNHFACSICDKKMSQKTKFYEFDLKPACKHCYEKFPSELKKRLKKAYESSPKK